MVLYKRLIRCRAIEACDPHIIPDEHYSDWFHEDEITNEELINQMKSKWGDYFMYYVQELFVPVKHEEGGIKDENTK